MAAGLDPQRRSALRAAKLAALVAGRWGPDERQRHNVGTAAALVGPGPAGPTGWVLADDAAERALGPALVWAERQGVDELHLVVDGPDGAAGTVARQAALFAAPTPAVWSVEGTSLAQATPTPAPSPAAAPAPPELVDLLIDAGLEIVAEAGLVRGEINGLEVARIVHGTTTAGVPIDEPQLEVGVGKADRELTAMVHGDLAPVDQLARVAEIVRRHRRPGAPRHPLNQLVPERWLRAILCRNPAIVDAASLRSAPAVRPRTNLTERDIALAVGEAHDDTGPVVVACSVGIALDLVPTAADAREALDPAARLVLAVPARDDHPGTRRLAARLRRPAAVVPVPGDWRAAG
jgi:hypothetical protein